MFGAWWERRPAPAGYTRQAGATGYRNGNTSHGGGNTSYGSNADVDESAEIQRAIQESLRNQNFRTNQNTPPSYGWNIPNEPSQRNNLQQPQHQQQQRNNLYPNIPPNDFGRSNLPPPFEPYGSNNGGGGGGNNGGGSGGANPPYPTTTNGMPTYPTTVNTDDEDRMRQARLRRFQQN